MEALARMEQIKKKTEEVIQKKGVIYTHTYQDLDNLMSRFLLLQIEPALKFKYLPAEELKKILDKEIVLDFPNGAIDHHDLPGQWSCCKLLFSLFNDNNRFAPYIKIIDYCHRADKGQLNRFERAQGSLIHIIYALRTHPEIIDDEKLYRVFEHLVVKASQSDVYLTGYCEMEVSSVFPELAEIILKETVDTIDILRNHIKFIDISRHNYIALNNSNFNMSAYLFSNYSINALIFKTPAQRAGILVRKGYFQFDLEQVYEVLSNAEPNVWEYQKNKILTKTAKSITKTNFSLDDLAKILIKSYKE